MSRYLLLIMLLIFLSACAEAQRVVEIPTLAVLPSTTPTETFTLTWTPSKEPTATITPLPSNTATEVFTETFVPTQTFTDVPTETPRPTTTPTITPSFTITNTRTPVSTATSTISLDDMRATFAAGRTPSPEQIRNEQLQQHLENNSFVVFAESVNASTGIGNNEFYLVYLTIRVRSGENTEENATLLHDQSIEFLGWDRVDDFSIILADDTQMTATEYWWVPETIGFRITSLTYYPPDPE